MGGAKAEVTVEVETEAAMAAVVMAAAEMAAGLEVGLGAVRGEAARVGGRGWRWRGWR